MSGAPPYAERLRLQHEVFRPELRELVLGLRRVASPDRGVLDLACGDGEFTGLLAEAFPSVPVVGIDASTAMIRRARGRWGGTEGADFLEADLLDGSTDLPPADLVFCADSLRSIEADELFDRMVSATEPGGTVVVLESDPVGELRTSADPGAEELFAVLKEDAGLPDGGATRRLGKALACRGGEQVKVRTVCAHRQAPFDGATLEWLGRHWRHRLGTLEEAGSEGDRARLRRTFDPESDHFFGHLPGAWFVHRRTLAWARVVPSAADLKANWDGG